MDDWNNDDDWIDEDDWEDGDDSLDVDRAGEFRVDGDVQKEIQKRLKIKDSITAKHVVRKVERAITLYRARWPSRPAKEERERYGRIQSAATKLLADLASLSTGSYTALVMRYWGNEAHTPFNDILPMLEALQKASSLCTKELHGSPKDAKREHERELVARLVEVIETYYPSDHPRRGRNSTFLEDTIEFVKLCLEAAGMPRIPGDESLYRRYILPPRKWLRLRNAILAHLKETKRTVYPSS